MLLSPDSLDGSCHVATASLGGDTHPETQVAVPAVSQRGDTLVAVMSASRSRLVHIHGMDGS